jgi:NADH:ubiquinone oxidoreductase subunit 6 (subunit J)
MYDFLFYIFFVITIASAMVAAFSKSLPKAAFALVLTLLAVSGLYVLLISELFALINILLLILTTAFLFMAAPKLKVVIEEENLTYSSRHFFFTIIVSLFTATVSGILSNTRWRVFTPDYSENSYALIFNAYLPLILAVMMIFYIITVSLGFYYKKTH